MIWNMFHHNIAHTIFVLFYKRYELVIKTTGAYIVMFSFLMGKWIAIRKPYNVHWFLFWRDKWPAVSMVGRYLCL